MKQNVPALFVIKINVLLMMVCFGTFSENLHAETLVQIQTNKGNIDISLDEKKAPLSVENFLNYVNQGFYEGIIFHRVIDDFMIQGGGFDRDMRQKKPAKPIKNEAGNGLSNQRGSIAMARTNDPHSASSQFFINLKDNDFLNDSPGRAGYAVFGKVISGMDVVDAIAKVPTTQVYQHKNVPKEPVEITKVIILPVEVEESEETPAESPVSQTE